MHIDEFHLRREWHRIFTIIAIGLLFTCCTVSGSPGNGTGGTNTSPAIASINPDLRVIDLIRVMNFTDEQNAMNNYYYNMEKVYTGIPFTIYPESRNLLGHIDYIPEQRNQGRIGNCWVWANTAALEAALDIQNGVKQRLSIQYFDSNYMGGSASGFNGGTPEEFAEFYNDTGIAIPWSNWNANYQDGPHYETVENTNKAYVDAEDIQTDLNYGIESISVEKIETMNVDQSTAINNIKTALNNDKPVLLYLALPNKGVQDQIIDLWNNHAESVPLDIGPWSEEPIDYTSKAAHEMLVVGYEGDDWIVLNSWRVGVWNGVNEDGTPFQKYIDRPNSLLRLKMDLDYLKYWPPENPAHSDYMGCGDACDPNLYLTKWRVLNVTFTEKSPLRPSIALDRAGKPHIAYFNRTGALLYGTWVDTPFQKSFLVTEQPGQWNISLVYPGSSSGNRYSSLAFDQTGNPHISFADAAGKNLKYASFVPVKSGGTWSIETVCHSVDGIGENSLAMTSNGPAISYYDYSTRSLDYATKETAGWHTRIVDGDSDVGGGNSLKMSAIEVPSISYTDYSRGALRFAQFMIPSQPNTIPHWQISTVDGPDISTYAGKYTSLALDSQGRPAITSYAEGVQNLKYAKWDGNQWKLQNAIPLTTDGVQGSFSSLALSVGTNPVFSMYDQVNKDLVYATKRPNTGGITTPWPWLDVSMEKVDTRGDVGRYNSLALSQANLPYIAYYDATNREVKIAWRALSAWKISTVGGSPRVSGITPAKGLVGQPVTVTYLSGDNFWTQDGVPPRVMLQKSGQSDVIAKNVKVNSSNKITCTFTLPAGPGATGTWDVTVNNPDGRTDTLRNKFTVSHAPPTLSAVSPNGVLHPTGIAPAPLKITLTGTGFRDGAAVTLSRTGTLLTKNRITATNVKVETPSRITCAISLAGVPTGKYDVAIANDDGQRAVLSSGFTIR